MGQCESRGYDEDRKRSQSHERMKDGNSAARSIKKLTGKQGCKKKLMGIFLACPCSRALSTDPLTITT